MMGLLKNGFFWYTEQRESGKIYVGNDLPDFFRNTWI